jgi:hypothetical protein
MVLEDHADLPPVLRNPSAFHAPRILPINDDLATGRAFNQCDQPEQRTFAGA